MPFPVAPREVNKSPEMKPTRRAYVSNDKRCGSVVGVPQNYAVKEDQNNAHVEISHYKILPFRNIELIESGCTHFINQESHITRNSVQ